MKDEQRRKWNLQKKKLKVNYFYIKGLYWNENVGIVRPNEDSKIRYEGLNEIGIFLDFLKYEFLGEVG